MTSIPFLHMLEAIEEGKYLLPGALDTLLQRNPKLFDNKSVALDSFENLADKTIIPDLYVAQTGQDITSACINFQKTCKKEPLVIQVLGFVFPCAVVTSLNRNIPDLGVELHVHASAHTISQKIIPPSEGFDWTPTFKS